MRIGWLMVACTGLSLPGCRSAPAARPMRLELEGVYEYVANMPGQQYRGTLRIVADTMLVEPAAEYCQPVTGVPDPMVLRYTCLGAGSYDRFLLAFDRRNPGQFSRWTAYVRVQKQRTVCVQYAVDAQGRQVCVRTTTEYYEVTESRSGRLEVRKITR